MVLLDDRTKRTAVPISLVQVMVFGREVNVAARLGQPRQCSKPCRRVKWSYEFHSRSP